MDKYRINRNRKRLTEQEIAQGKDFDRFLSAYEASKVPFYKTPKFYLSVATVGVIIAVGAYLAVSGDDKALADQPFIDPLIEGVDVQDTSFTADAAAADTFSYYTGSQIYIPANAFLDNNGKPVNGNVELRYREFHTPAEILVAGIPMTYDSAGERRHFESAGMLEISAWQNGKPLKANPASPIKIEMVSPTDEDKFNIYYLDTAAKKWDYVSRDKGVLQRPEKNADSDSAATLTATITEPVKPAKATAGAKGFVIAVDAAQFPELAVYKGVNFEVDETKTPYDRALSKIEWDDAVVKKNGNQSYTVTFSKGEEKHSFTTRIVFKDQDYGAAMKVYEEKYREYQAMLGTRQNNEKTHVAGLTAEQQKMDAERLAANFAAMQRAAAMRGSLGAQTEDVVMRTFLVINFGIWNSDCPSSLPEGAEIFVKLTDEKEKELNPEHIYLVERGRNAIFTYYKNDLQRFRYNPNSDNVVITVLGENKIAIISNDEFSAIDTTKKEHTFKLRAIEQKLQSTADVQRLLRI